MNSGKALAATYPRYVYGEFSLLPMLPSVMKVHIYGETTCLCSLPRIGGKEPRRPSVVATKKGSSPP